MNQTSISHSDKNSAEKAAASKYSIGQALSDYSQAVRFNPGAYVVAMISVALFALVAQYLILDLPIELFGLDLLGMNLLLFILVILILQTVFFAVVSAFANAYLSLVLTAGMERRKIAPGPALIQSLRLIRRVWLASALYAFVSYWPLAITGTYAVGSLFVGGLRYGNDGGGAIFFIAYLASLIWLLIATLRYCLVDFVAIFEPKVPVQGTLKRSQHLQGTEGQWFVFKGGLLLLVGLIALAILSGEPGTKLEDSDNPIVLVGFVIMALLVNGALLMLYRNRVKVRV